jgi:K+-sensing histidine kinase KdpD
MLTEHFDSAPRASFVRGALAVVCPVVAVMALAPVRNHIENTNVALGIVILVLLAAAVGGRRAGMIAAISSAVAFDFFFTRPFASLRVAASKDLQTTVLLACIGAIGGELVDRARRSGARAAIAQAALDTTYQRAELAAGSDNPGRLIRLAVQELTRALDLKSCRYVSGKAPTSLPELAHNSILVPATVDPSTRGLVALPVRAHGRAQGYFLMAFPTNTVGTSLTSDQRHAAVALADQVGVGLLKFNDR